MQHIFDIVKRMLPALLASILPLAVSAATLSLSPASGSYSVDDTITVSVLINTTGAAIDGVDLHYLRYNPSLLELKDADTTRNDIQIAAGSLMSNTVLNMVDTSQGRIDFSQLTAGGIKFTSNGAETFATMQFRVKSAGNASLTFDAIPGSSTDTNVVAVVKELLTSATGASYTLSVNTSSSGGSSGGGSSSGGGGGGGGGGGSVFLPAPSSFSALGGPDQILLRWVNPISSSFVRARVIRKENSQPVSASDGIIIFEGDTQGYTDTTVKAGVTYYYAIFSLDTALRASALSISKATVGDFTEQQIITKVSEDELAGKTSSATIFTSFAYRFSVALQEGFIHEEVRQLQKFLNSLGFIIVSAGTGSPGNETTYFGALTKNALARFQAKYLPAIATGDRGLVGPQTRAKLNELASKGVVTPAPIIPVPSGVSYTFARNLTLESQGEDVRQLQKFLNANGFIIISAGDGSPGNETDFFGNLTKAAIIRFQEKYAGEVLTPAQLIKGSGFFGQLSRNKAHQLMQKGVAPSQQSTSVNTSSLQEQINAAQAEIQRLLQQLQTRQGS